METNFQYFKFKPGMILTIQNCEFSIKIKVISDTSDTGDCKYCALKQQTKLCQVVNCCQYGGFHFIKLEEI